MFIHKTYYNDKFSYIDLLLFTIILTCHATQHGKRFRRHHETRSELPNSFHGNWKRSRDEAVPRQAQRGHLSRRRSFQQCHLFWFVISCLQLAVPLQTNFTRCATFFYQLFISRIIYFSKYIFKYVGALFVTNCLEAGDPVLVHCSDGKHLLSSILYKLAALMVNDIN